MAVSERLLRLSPAVQRIGLCVLILLTWGYYDLVRWEELTAGNTPRLAWRWSPTSEEVFLKQPHTIAGWVTPPRDPATGAAKPWQLLATDWPEFSRCGAEQSSSWR